MTHYPIKQRIAAWLVHLLTASTAVVGLYTLKAIVDRNYLLAFWLMAIAIFVDAIDGTLARRVKTHIVAARIDGSLLDNIVDYLNYVITPCFLLLMHPSLLPLGWRHAIICLIILASAYQFTQCDAKTDDHFFKGFPCYWNFAVFYLFISKTTMVTNSIILFVLTILVFVPLKYVYPSRLENLTRIPWLKKFMQICTVIFTLANVVILSTYPTLHTSSVACIIAYMVLYFSFSIYRSVTPLPIIS